MAFSISVTDPNAILLLSAVVSIIVLLLKVVGKASDKFSFVMIGAITSAVLMQMYNFWFLNVDTLQLAGSTAQFWVWAVLTVAISWFASLIPSVVGYAVVALICLAGVAGSVFRGPDFIDEELGLDVGAGLIAGFWILIAIIVLAVWWMDSVWAPFNVFLTAIVDTVIIILILGVLQMYVSQAQQTGYDLITFDWQLLVEFAIVLGIYSVVYYYYYRQIYKHEEEKKKHKYTRIALAEYAVEDKKEKEALKAQLAVHTEEPPTPSHHKPLPPPHHYHHHHHSTPS